MRRIGLTVLLIGRFAWAQPSDDAAALTASTDTAVDTGAQPDDAYASCLAIRHDIYTQASTKSDVSQRVRMLRMMPTCTPGMSDDGALAVSSARAVEIGRETEKDWRWSLTWQPFPVLKNTYLFGVSFSPLPHVAVGLHGGMGRTQHVEIGSLYHWYYTDGTDEYRALKFTEKQIGAHVSYFFTKRMEGIEVGADVTYQHFGDVDAADRVTNVWKTVEGFTTAAFFGWKDITRDGITIEIQAGPQMIGMRTDNKPMIDTDWHFDNAVHLYTRAQGGYSF